MVEYHSVEAGLIGSFSGQCRADHHFEGDNQLGEHPGYLKRVVVEAGAEAMERKQMLELLSWSADLNHRRQRQPQRASRAWGRCKGWQAGIVVFE